ncbi:MAG: ATPase P [Eubacterium sp.]|nr:ATPase P [Eubacterium sp.]SEF46553.1 Copper chaperone CopZ [Eubacterium ruminantium]
MTKTTVGIDGMMCSMCEAHTCDAIRRNLKVKKVKASHKKGIAEIISEDAITEEDVNKALLNTGYKITSFSSEEYTKKGLFSK